MYLLFTIKLLTKFALVLFVESLTMIISFSIFHVSPNRNIIHYAQILPCQRPQAVSCQLITTEMLTVKYFLGRLCTSDKQWLCHFFLLQIHPLCTSSCRAKKLRPLIQQAVKKCKMVRRECTCLSNLSL